MNETMLMVSDRCQEKVESFWNLERMRKRIYNIPDSVYRRNQETYDTILSIIEEQINFRRNQDAADERFIRDAYGDEFV